MYRLPVLPYSFDDLEPFIDTHTLGLHYHKHEQNYLNKLNQLLKESNYDFKCSLNELLYQIKDFPKVVQEDLLFNLGGVLNHNLYWKSMNPKRRLPIGNLKSTIDKQYGDFENLWAMIKKKALALKGSGYTFLVLKTDGQLEVINVHNQDYPLLLGYIPLFNIDLWEHAYYLNYKNEKERYIDNFKEIADFTYASNVFNSLIK